MVPQIGFRREAFEAVWAAEGFLLGVDATVAQELGGHTKRLGTVRTLEAARLCVDAAVVFQRHEVQELFVADTAEEGTCLVAVAVVEK